MTLLKIILIEYGIYKDDYTEIKDMINERTLYDNIIPKKNGILYARIYYNMNILSFN